MKLTILGCHGPYPGPGRATSGYLLEEGETRILVDCGSGVLGRLQRYCALSGLTAVFLSHLHGDHVADMAVMGYAIDFALRRREREHPLPVYAPPEPPGDFQRLGYKQAVLPVPIDPGVPVVLAGWQVTFARTEHPLLCYAMAFEKGGKKLVYSADTGPSREVEELARDAGLFLCEVNLGPSGEAPGHLSVEEAAGMARRAGAGRLVLTHLFPGHDPRALEEKAVEAFGPGAFLAREGESYQL